MLCKSTITPNTQFKKNKKEVKTIARTRVISRTVKTTVVDVLCLDIVNGEPFNKTVELNGYYKDDRKLFKIVEKEINIENTVKAVHIVGKTEGQKRYAMLESDFIKVANVI